MTKLPRASEHDTQKAILEYLNVRGHFAMRINTGAFGGDYKGKKWFIRTAPKGCPDIVGIVKNTGIFFGIEVKAHGKKPSEDQESMLAQIRNCQGIAVVAESIDDIKALGL